LSRKLSLFPAAIANSQNLAATARSKFSKFSLLAAIVAYSEHAKSSPAAAAFTFKSPFRSYNRASPSVHGPQVLIADPVTATFATVAHAHAIATFAAATQTSSSRTHASTFANRRCIATAN